MRIQGKRKGLALGTILLSLMVFSAVLFTAVSGSLSHLKLVESGVRGDHARNLAEAALSKAIYQLIDSNFDFGKDGTGGVVVQLAGLPAGEGKVTFDAAESGFSRGYSTYNLDSDSSVTGAASHSVPPRSVHLVARGKVGQTERWMECVYYKPPFPDGLAATGPVKADALYLAGVRNSEQYVAPPGQIPPDQLLPANLFSNASLGFRSGEPASEVGQNCVIKGSAGAVGAVSVHPSSIVEGEVSPGSAARSIPKIDVVARIQALEPNAIPISSTGGSLSLPPQWFSSSTGTLTVGGDLDLNGSALLVRSGDLVVSGAVKGSGIVLVDGNIDIGDGDVSTSDRVAVACTGSFRLRAPTPDGNFFKGLVYAENRFEARDITVLGATIVNGNPPEEGSAVLDNVRLITSPGTVTVAMRRPQAIPLKHSGGSINYAGAFSFTMRRGRPANAPANSPDGFYVDCRAYYSDRNEVIASGSTIEHDPIVWHRDSEFLPLGGGTTSHPGHTVTEPNQEIYHVDGANNSAFDKSFLCMTSIPDVYVGGPQLDLNLVKTKIVDPINLFFKDSIGATGHGWYDKTYPDSDKEKVRIAVNQALTAMAAGTPDAFTITFDLNNLMPDLNGSSRIRMWRPYTP